MTLGYQQRCVRRLRMHSSHATLGVEAERASSILIMPISPGAVGVSSFFCPAPWIARSLLRR